MGPTGCEDQHWLIEPLLDAGVPLEEIRTLLVRLACEDDGLLAPFVDQPPRVRAAWHETIGRMLVSGDPPG